MKKKWIQIQVISLRFTEYFQIFCFIFFRLILSQNFRNEEIFIIPLFPKVQICVLGVKKFFCIFWLIFHPLDPDPDPWIRIFLRIRIQEAKILRIQRFRIRILSTEQNCKKLPKKKENLTHKERTTPATKFRYETLSWL